MVIENITIHIADNRIVLTIYKDLLESAKNLSPCCERCKLYENAILKRINTNISKYMNKTLELIARNWRNLKICFYVYVHVCACILICLLWFSHSQYKVLFSLLLPLFNDWLVRYKV